MTGPATGIRTNVRLTYSYDTGSSASTEDEPWDQRNPSTTVVSLDDSVRNGDSETNRIAKGSTMKELQRVRGERGPSNNGNEEDLLDDGDLPSLSRGAAGNSSTMARVLGGMRAATRPPKATSSSKKAVVTPTVERRYRKGAIKEAPGSSYEESEADESLTRPSYQTPYRSPAKGRYSDDRPDDELDERDLMQNPTHSDLDKEYESDYSGPTVESLRTEEELEDEPYDGGFCGHTLNALGDICGGTLIGTGSGRDENMTSQEPGKIISKKMKEDDRARERARARARQTISARSSKPAPPSTYPEAQQEHTAIEVEFVEPVKPLTSNVKESESANAKTKSIYLAAMARKAKENFISKKAKKSKNVTKKEMIQPQQQTGKGGLDPTLDSEEFAAAAAMTAASASRDMEGDDDYSNFNATEKRKFIKLINSGMTAAGASQSIVAARSNPEKHSEDANVRTNTESEAKRITPKSPRSLAFWKRNQNRDRGAENFVEDVQSTDRDEKSPDTTEAGEDFDAMDGVNAIIPTAVSSESYEGLGTDSEEDYLVDYAADNCSREVEKNTAAEYHRRELEEKAAKENVRLELEQKAAEEKLQREIERKADEEKLQLKLEQKSADEKRRLEFERNAGEEYVRRELDKNAIYSADSFDGPDRALPEPVAVSPDVHPVSEDRSARHPFSDGDSVPFQRSGNSYYDAIRREMKDDRSVSVDTDNEEKSAFPSLRGSDASKHARSIISGRANGFTELEDSPESKAKRSVSQPQPLPSSRQQQKKVLSSGVAVAGAAAVGSLFRNTKTSNYEKVVSPATKEGSLSKRNEDRELFPQTERSFEEIVPVPFRDEDFISGDEGESPSPTSSANKEAIADGDVSMNAYLKSTAETYGASDGGVPVNDNVSVYTTGTTVTNATSYTQSSRIRRPGAAKSRLAKQKQVEQKKSNGWHETIRAAAVSANRNWDPKKGWINYAEPEVDSDEADLPSDSKDVHNDLDKSILSTKEEVEDEVEGKETTATSIAVPFPQSWQKERDDMLSSGDTTEKTDDAALALKTPTLNAAKDESITAVSDSQDIMGIKSRSPMLLHDDNNEEVAGQESESDGLLRPDKKRNRSKVRGEASSGTGVSTGWMESMRNASANLAKRGKIWDPVKGWTNGERGHERVPDIVDFDDISKPDDDLGSASDVPKMMAAKALQSKPETIETDFTARDDQQETEKRSIDPLSNAIKDSSPNSMEVEPALKAVESQQKESVSRYYSEPIALTRSDGSVLSVETADDHATEIVVSEIGEFPAMDKSRVVVDVVKEKVDEDDLNFFPQENSKNLSSVNDVRNDASLDGKLKSAIGSEAARVATSFVRDQSSVAPSVTSSRRGAGPVDMDEVDETWDSDDETRQSTAWQSESQAMSRSVGSKSVQSDISPHSKPFSERAVGGLSSLLSRPIPKLKGSARDTSPISIRKTIQEKARPDSLERAPCSENDSETSQHRHESPFRKRIATSDQQAPNSPVAMHGPSEFVGGTDHQRLNHDESVGLTETTSKGSTRKNTRQSPMKARLQEWETRIETAHSADKEDVTKHDGKKRKETIGPIAAAGWKTFLGKKVQAESAAAAGKSASVSSVSAERKVVEDSSYGNKMPESNQIPSNQALSRTKKEHQLEMDEDSLFEFVPGKSSRQAFPIQSTQGNHVLDLSDLSPIHANADISELDNDAALSEVAASEVTASEAYGPTEEERRSSSFLQRLTECAAPMMPAKSPSFFRPTSNTAQTSKYLPSNLCGNTGMSDGPGSVAASFHSSSTSERHRRSSSIGDEKPRSKSTSRAMSMSRPSQVSHAASSVVSDDFGAKTAYLDSLAMKTAVSRTRSSSSRRRRERSSGSSVASGATEQSEKWRSFLERKRGSGASTSSRSKAGDSDVSRAAEKYASGKVEEIMNKMNHRSLSVARSRELHKEVVLGDKNKLFLETSGKDMQGSESEGNGAAAAEDLAAARVEAMMTALSGQYPKEIDEGEI